MALVVHSSTYDDGCLCSSAKCILLASGIPVVGLHLGKLLTVGIDLRKMYIVCVTVYTLQ